MFKTLLLSLSLSFVLISMLGCSRMGMAIGPNSAGVRAGIPLN